MKGIDRHQEKIYLATVAIILGLIFAFATSAWAESCKLTHSQKTHALHHNAKSASQTCCIEHNSEPAKAEQQRLSSPGFEGKSRLITETYSYKFSRPEPVLKTIVLSSEKRGDTNLYKRLGRLLI